MVLCKNGIHIPLNRAISQCFDAPLVILQAEVGADDHSPKLIKVWVLDEAKPWSPFYLAYNGEFRARGQPWRNLQLIRISTRLAKVLPFYPITTLRYLLEAFVPLCHVSQNDPMQNWCPYFP